MLVHCPGLNCLANVPHTVLCGDLYTACVDASRTVFWDHSGFKSNAVLQLFMSKTSKIQCMQCDALNGMHVKDVEDIKNTCTFCNLQLFVQ